jgi:hypothetical protein
VRAGAIDYNRLGGLEWARATGGALTRRERTRLLAAVAAGQYEYLLGRVKLATGRVPSRAAEVDVDDFAPPDSRLAREAEAACAEQPASVAGHSYRTWMFGRALSAFDRAELDSELFYAAALMHDHGLAEPTPGRCFTLASAERALEAAAAADVEPGRAEHVADAICVHATPGVAVERDGALGCYVQWGAMVDVAGLRLWDVHPRNVEKTLAKHPRGQVRRELSRYWALEAKAVPRGRFAFLRRCGALVLVRLAPFDD